MLPSITEKTVIHDTIYRDLFLLQKLLNAITEDLKKRAAKHPGVYPVTISERKNYVYESPEKILQTLIKKYPIEKFAKLKGYTDLTKVIDGKILTDFTVKGLIKQNNVSVLKLEG